MNSATEDFIPGTIHLIDLQGTVLSRHSIRQQDIILVPAPSDDVNDPLNWTSRRKFLAISCMCVYTLMVGIASAAIYSILIPISEDTGLSLASLNQGTGYMFLLFGWGCLFWQPLALQYGKRPVYLISIFATMAICLWAPYTRTNGQWIANKILQGFFGAPIESLCQVSVTDVYFTHERGRYIALYGLFLAGSNFFAPIIAGFIADSQGWRWVLYWCAIFCGIGFIYLLLFMEETNFARPTLTGQKLEANCACQASVEPASYEKNPDINSKAPAPEFAPTNQQQAGASTKTFWDRMRLFQPGIFTLTNKLPQIMTRPLIFLTFPIVVYSGFLYGSALIWFNVLNGPLLGTFVGAGFTGLLGDKFMIRMARKKGGFMEPEYRLWLLSLNLVLFPCGLILWGVGASQQVHWFGLVFAMFMIGAANTSGLQIAIAYCIDAYRDFAGETTITVIIIRNTMSFAIGYGITPWVTNLGYQNAFISAAFVSIAQILTFFIMIKWGKRWRKASTGKVLSQMRRNHSPPGLG